MNKYSNNFKKYKLKNNTFNLKGGKTQLYYVNTKTPLTIDDNNINEYTFYYSDKFIKKITEDISLYKVNEIDNILIGLNSLENPIYERIEHELTEDEFLNIKNITLKETINKDDDMFSYTEMPDDGFCNYNAIYQSIGKSYFINDIQDMVDYIANNLPREEIILFLQIILVWNGIMTFYEKDDNNKNILTTDKTDGFGLYSFYKDTFGNYKSKLLKRYDDNKLLKNLKKIINKNNIISDKNNITMINEIIHKQFENREMAMNFHYNSYKELNDEFINKVNNLDDILNYIKEIVKDTDKTNGVIYLTNAGEKFLSQMWGYVEINFSGLDSSDSKIIIKNYGNLKPIDKPYYILTETRGGHANLMNVIYFKWDDLPPKIKQLLNRGSKDYKN